MKLVFWLSIFAVLYAYLGYIGLLWLFSVFKNNPVRKRDIIPFVSLVISAYNEEKVIALKIENTLDLDYPEDLLEIAIISDGSTDRTNDIIREYAERDKRVLPCIVAVNKGKDACLNDFVPGLKGEVILFSDATSFYKEDLIRTIVRPFSDERVGFVTGSTRYFTSSDHEGETNQPIGIYSRLERLTKLLESRIDSCVGADGAVFVIRKALFSPLKPYEINDLTLPLLIVEKGYRGVLEETAFCRERAADGMQNEFRRQVRITTGTLRSLFSHKALLCTLSNTFFLFEVISHKAMKLITPFLLILILVSNCIIALRSSFYATLLGLQLFFYVLAFSGYKCEKTNNIGRLIQMATTFTLTNIAMLKGWLAYFTRKDYSTWSPERSQL
ncbi:MAG: glycosyltransferase family 2 protein [Thermodesulfobacteriota bacterium]|nr:glycosyltransferase family 2 protein [Thermodesulfobacteriota bacterium]